jgi:CDP-glycerol glycerophosphotransferase
MRECRDNGAPSVTTLPGIGDLTKAKGVALMAPRLTVVVPVYNVEAYLAECLDSIAGQTLRDLDVVIVDDGSTDDSPRIAAEYAAKDSRFRVVTQENAGLGAARNTGVRNADPETDYLAFVDSDDIIPDYAYQLCVTTLDSTGSDFLSGNVMLLDSKGTSQSPMHRMMNSTRLRTHISKDRRLVYDRLAPNKIFRRSFWDLHAMAFPEGVLYEDIPLTLPAHFRATAIDVVKECVYYWRQREGGGASITQRRTELIAVRDRIAACDSVSRFLAAQRGARFPEYKRWYDTSAISSDIKIFLDLLLETDDEFRALFMERARDYLSRVDPRVIAGLPMLLRLKWTLIGQDRLPELLEVLQFEKVNGTTSIPVLRRFHRYAKYPFLRDPKVDLPDSLYRLHSELSLRAKALEITWEGDKVRFRGHAYISNLNVHKKHMSLKVVGFRNPKTKQRFLRPIRTLLAPEATAASGQGRYSYDWAGFEFTLDPAQLKQKGKWTDGSWRIAMGVLSRGVLRKARLGIESGVEPLTHYLNDYQRLVVLPVSGRLEVRIETIGARLATHRRDGDDLVLGGEITRPLPMAATPGMLRLHHLVTGRVLTYPTFFSDLKGNHATFQARVPMADIAAGRQATSHATPSLIALDLESPASGGRYPFDQEADPDALRRELLVIPNGPRHLMLHDRVVTPLIDAVTWGEDGGLRLEGDLCGQSAEHTDLVLRYSAHFEEHAFALRELPGGRFAAELNPAAIASVAGTLPLRSGRWHLVMRPHGAATVELAYSEIQVGIAPDRLSIMPAETTVRGRRYQIRRSGLASVYLQIESELALDEYGPYRQKVLRQTYYPKARQQPLRHAVLYDSYTGKQFSDTPRAVFEELTRRGVDIEHLWIVRDQQVDLPPGATPVRMWGRDWYDALARCKYIVTNAHLPDWIQRREGQVVVQAWHGTPLKKIGWDIEDVQFANGNYLEKVARESKSWSFMVSPNRFSTPILRRAMRYDGEILEAGYPRNDVLYAADREQRATAVRERIGLPAGKRAVLYAPTWRDDQFYGPGRYKLDLRLDLEAAQRALGDDWVLMVRKHPNVVDTVPGAGDGFVFDVSAFPDINELFLAADVLITDYSSLLFDFANTGRPMLFFTYDLEHYRDKLRGFYFDFSERAPGPLISTSDELIAAIQDIDGVAEKYRAQYEAFQRDFCDLDDGQATSRVIARMMELGGEAPPAV